MIPKTIHLIDIGGDLSLSHATKYADSIRKFAANFQVCIWNEENLPEEVLYNHYYQEAIQHQKFAFASDVARVYLLLSIGGVYIDTDVEFVKSIDALMKYSFVIGLENRYTISTAFIAACPHNEIIQDMWNLYAGGLSSNFRFLKVPNVELFSTVMRDRGFILNGKAQLQNGELLCSQNVFSPQNFFDGSFSDMDEDTIAIHRFSGSWVSGKTLKLRLLALLVRISNFRVIPLIRYFHRLLRHY